MQEAHIIRPEARYAVSRALAGYEKHITQQLVEVPDNQRTLQPGLIGSQVLRHAKKFGVTEAQLWDAILELCIVWGRKLPTMEIGEGPHFAVDWPVLYFLSTSNTVGDYQLTLSLIEWRKLVQDYNRDKMRREIGHFLAWVEASCSLYAYRLYKANKNCYQRDGFASLVNQVVERLGQSQGTFANGERDKIFRESIDSLKSTFNRPIPDWEVGKLHDPEPSQWHHQALDCWLFQVWPLVKHYNWTMKELLAVILEKKKVRPAGQFKDLNLEEHPCQSPDALGQHCRVSLGLRHENRPLGQPKKTPGQHAYLPTRWELAVNL